MAKKKKSSDHAGPGKYTNPNYYDLKTDAVDRLANAEKIVAERRAAEEAITGKKGKKTDPGKQYRKSFLDKIPSWIKAVFIKFWFNGAVCYFIFWGLGIYVTDSLDMTVIMAIVLGMVTDILVNNAFRFLERYEGQNSRWMMFPKKRFWTFIANILYAFVVLVGVMVFYNIINIFANNINGTEGEMYIGVEPILFGLSYLAIDMAFIGIKHLLMKIVSDAKQRVNNNYR